MGQFIRYPLADITSEPTRPLKIVHPTPRLLTTPTRRKYPDRQFWLRCCALLIIVSVELAGLVLYLSLANISISLNTQPTPIEYPCAHVVIAQQNGNLARSVDYSCH